MRAHVLAIAFLLGCGGSSVDINTDQSNVCSQVAEVACHNLYQCCAEGEIEKFLGVSDPRTEAECQVDFTRRCARQIAAFDFGISQKHLKFDAKTMNTCLNALVAPSSTCATIESALPWTDACMNSAWVGQQADGDDCLASDECASTDSFCGASQKCVALPGDGQPCSNFGCVTGAFCSAGTCRAQLAAGGACTSSVQCLKGLFCDVSAAQPACAALHAPGDACAGTGNDSCSSTKCNLGTCGTSTQTCATSSTCLGNCGATTTLCNADSQCGAGACSIGGAVCFSQAGCIDPGSTCVFPVKCNHPACVGAVCADSHVVVDYCQGALNDLPVP
jgi:hypothetical protein